MQKDNKFYDPEFDRKDGYTITIIGTVIGVIALIVIILATVLQGSLISSDKTYLLELPCVALGIVALVLGKIGGKKCGLKYKLFARLATFSGVVDAIFGAIMVVISLSGMKG